MSFKMGVSPFLHIAFEIFTLTMFREMFENIASIDCSLMRLN